MTKRVYSGKLLTLGALLSFTCAGSPAFAGAVVHWEAPGLLLRVMLASPETADALTGPRPGDGVSNGDIHCGADVYRPELDEGWATTAGNRLSCSFPLGTDGAGGAAVFSLAETAVQAWGNRFDKPLHFSIDAQTSQAFFAALKRARTAAPLDPNLDSLALSGPDGSCTETYFINAQPEPESPAALACSQDTGPNGQVTLTRCSFFSF